MLFLSWLSIFQVQNVMDLQKDQRVESSLRTCVGGKNAGTLNILGQILLTMIWQTVFIIKAIIKLYEILAS